MTAHVQIERLNYSHLDAVLHLQHAALTGLPERGIVYPSAPEQIRAMLSADGIVLGACAAGRLIAFSAAWFPGESEENLGRVIGLPTVELSRVVHQEIDCVHPHYRGLGLQRRLGSMNRETLRAAHPGRYRWLLCTVSPFNRHSLRNRLEVGDHILALRPLWGDSLRYVLGQHLRTPLALTTSDSITLPLGDLPRQQILLNAGYYGCGLEGPDDALWLRFARPAGLAGESLPFTP